MSWKIFKILRKLGKVRVKVAYYFIAKTVKLIKKIRRDITKTLKFVKKNTKLIIWWFTVLDEFYRSHKGWWSARELHTERQ